ncbi:MAG: sulfotransferase [Alphaproteobacteria bacterium]
MTASPPLAPVFVGGPLRAGTTLLGSLIAGDPYTVCLPESPFLTDIVTETGPLDQTAADALFERIRRTRPFLAWLEQGPYTPPVMTPERNGAVCFVEDLVRQYAVHTGKPDAVRFVDHTPQNVLRTDLLRARFPNARFVTIVRDGRAVAASVLPLDFGPDEIIGAARMWLRYTGAGLAAHYALGPDVCRIVRFEDLVRNPAPVLSMIASHCAMPSPAGHDVQGGFRVPGFNRSIHGLVGQAPDPERIEAWRRALSSRQVRIFEHEAGDVLRYLGYALDNPQPCRGPGRLERIGFEIAAYIRGRRNRRREARVYERFAQALRDRMGREP